jgi:ABC-type phosphate/phosphonate transport system substrate-binding protein
MRLASIAMYVTSRPLADATAELWSFLRQYLSGAGLADLPERLDEAIPYDEAWTHQDLLLSQTCGYPYAKRLRGKARLVATPVYGHLGCDGPLMRSFLIVPRSSAVESIGDLRGKIAAINTPDSNSGMNLLRATIAPFARGGRFFSEVIETGSHGGSIAAVAAGRADVAAIDCVTFGNIRRFDAERLRDIRILAETASGPGLSFITSTKTTTEELALLREALAAAVAAPLLEATRDVLSLRGFAELSDADYDVLLDLETAAVSAGYPIVG